MFRPRLIVVLLVGQRGLVKSARFRDHIYVGDPVNAVRIFSDFAVDELMVLDIEASRQDRTISSRLLQDVAEEARVPLSVGGGIRKVATIGDMVSAGVEKVVVGSRAVEDPDLIRRASNEFGSSAISVCIDVAGGTAREEVLIRNGTHPSGYDPIEFAKMMEQMGAGELVIQSIDNDGQMSGYNLDLVRRVSAAVSVPVVALGGGRSEDFQEACSVGLASAAAAGSAFVFFRRRGAVLLNYPSREERSGC